MVASLQSGRSCQGVNRTGGRSITLLDQVTPGDFVLPWNRGGVRALNPLNPLSGSRYRGINWLVLSTLAGLAGVRRSEEQSFSSARFATYRQWSEAGYQVRAGSQGIPLVFYKQLGGRLAVPGQTEAESPATEAVKPGRPRRVLKAFTVFAAEQVDGAEGFLPDPVPAPFKGFDTAAFVSRLDLHIEHGSQRAASVRNLGYVLMPLHESFTDDESYVATLFHEVIHWTSPQLGRRTVIEGMFSDEQERYAFEELVAEIGSTMLCGHYGIRSSAQPSNAAYLASWLQALGNDRSYIMRATAKAQEAADWVIAKDGGAAGDANAEAEADAPVDEVEAEAVPC